jgi:ADP-heptose:LPS heptosyltransferase
LPAIPAPYLVFNIHAGELSLERRWPLEFFRSVIQALLARRKDLTAIIIGHGKAEVRYASLLGPMDRVMDVCGKLTFEETVRVIANAELLVTNDTGPLHLGLATNTRIVGLFGPTRGVTYLPPGRTNAPACRNRSIVLLRTIGSRRRAWATASA